MNVGITDRAKIFFTNTSKLLSDRNCTIILGEHQNLSKAQDTLPVPITLLLAVPRPLRLERILPVITCVGVTKLYLIDVQLVEKSYFGKKCLIIVLITIVVDNFNFIRQDLIYFVVLKRCKPCSWKV